MSVLSFMRWAENYHLFILGALSFASAYFGRTAARRRWQQWARIYLTGMGASYIFMLTAFYVDNGKNLPLCRELPQIAIISLSTKKIRGLHENDFIMASKINRVLDRSVGPRPP
jgi:hypothetical protein